MKRGESGIAAHLEIAVEINEEIKQKMVEYLQSFEAGMKKAGEFSAEQAPLVVQEFLAWEFWSHFTGAVACLVLLLIIAVVLWNIYKSTEPFDELRFAGSLFSTFAAVGLMIGLAVNSYSAGKVAVAPRIVVLEKIATLVK